MKTPYTFLLAALLSFAFISCNNKEKKADDVKTVKEVKKEIIAEKIETVSLNISGMTCEIGCAKTIQSKLSKKEGVTSAKVIFTDSLATVQFDANRTSKKDLISFIDGIAGGDLYKASEVAKEK